MTAPERISISPTYNQKRDDDYYLVDRDAFPGKGTEYIRADIADARVAAAYEAAAELARKCWHDPESEFSDAYVPDAIHALTPADAKAALEAVRREAKAEALREAAGSCDTFDGPVSDSDFVAGQSTAAQQIRSAILALLDNPQEDET